MIRAVMRLAILSVAGMLVAGAAFVVLARALGWQAGLVYFMVSLTPYAAVVALVAALLALLLGARWLALVGVLVFAVVAVWWAPMFWQDRPAAPESGLRVMTANLAVGAGDSLTVVEAVRAHRVDVVAVQELTSDAVSGLQAAGLGRALPHSYLLPGEGATGSGIWSRYRLTQRTEIEGTAFANIGTVIETHAGSVLFVGVHPLRAELLSGDSGSADRRRVTEYLRATTGPIIVAGDFNATWDNVPVRELVEAGFIDAVDSAGAGLVRTWPSGSGRWPPVVGIDHVFSRGMPPARGVEVIAIPGSDHLAMLASF
ncbi:MAG: endonuclease/exonuclease/phosphatase family protein [Candidatus Nanopelagicales bacterium]|nr:endonuclease/exonuclease/phosphatase family protein [Candidatus Nanopelagicales bacterium]